MSTAEEDFKKSFDATAASLAEGNTGTEVATEVAPAPAAAPAATEPAPAAAAPAADPAAPAAAPAPAPTPEAKKLADTEAENRLLKEQLAKATAAAPAPAASPAAAAPAAAPVAPAEPAAPKPYEYTQEQKDSMTEYEKEWPDHVAYQKIQRDAMQHELLNGVQALLTDFAKKVQDGLAPVVNTHLQSETEKHFAAIQTAHKDYAEVIDLVPEWIKTQPAYVQKAMLEVYGDPEKGTGGSAKDVIDLLNQFKQATGRAQPQTPSPTAAATAPAAPAAAAPAAPKPDEKKVAALTVVPAQATRVATSQPAVPDDFASAFNKTVVELTTVAK